MMGVMAVNYRFSSVSTLVTLRNASDKHSSKVSKAEEVLLE